MGEFQDVESEDKIMDEDEEEFFDEDEGEEVYPCEAWVSIYIKYIYNPLIRQFFFFFLNRGAPVLKEVAAVFGISYCQLLLLTIFQMSRLLMTSVQKISTTSPQN